MLGEENPLTHELGALIDRIRRRDEAVSESAGLARFSPFAVQSGTSRSRKALPESTARPASGRQSPSAPPAEHAAGGAVDATGVRPDGPAVAMRLPPSDDGRRDRDDPASIGEGAFRVLPRVVLGRDEVDVPVE